MGLLEIGQDRLLDTHLHSQSVSVEMQVDLTIDFLALSQQGRQAVALAEETVRQVLLAVLNDAASIHFWREVVFY